jgi:hypothetical protein
MLNLPQRSKELAATPGFSPWRAMARVYGRWWITIAVFLALYALFDFGLGWDAYRSLAWAYFPAIAVLIAMSSTPRRLSARAAAWVPYAVAAAVFVVLSGVFIAVLGWTPAKSTLVAAYLATGVLAIAIGMPSTI